LIPFFTNFYKYQPGSVKMEGCPLVHPALRPDPATMAVDDGLDQGQADPGPFILVGPVEALEDAEDLVVESHVKADAVVPDIIDPPAVPGRASRLDLGLPPAIEPKLRR